MTLFEVPSGRRVQLTSRRIRWADGGEITVLAEDVTWEGLTTGSYWLHEGVERRLLLEHTLGFHENDGVWQRDINCYIIE